MRLPTAGGSTMVSQSRYACGTMRVMHDHNTSAPLSRHLIWIQTQETEGMSLCLPHLRLGPDLEPHTAHAAGHRRRTGAIVAQIGNGSFSCDQQPCD